MDYYAADVKDQAFKADEYTVLTVNHPPVAFSQPERPRRSCCRLTIIVILAILINLALAACVFWLVNLSTSSSSSSNPLNPNSPNCITPMNQILGTPSVSGQPARSNCNMQTMGTNMYALPPQTVPNQMQEIQTGYQWQSLEYVTRSLVVMKQVILPMQNTPAALWEAPAVTTIDGMSTMPFVGFSNGMASEAAAIPAVGDVIVYAPNAANGLPGGHTSVVVAVKGDYVFVAEQNWSNAPWTNSEYARALQLVRVDGAGSGSGVVNQPGSQPQGSTAKFMLVDGPFSILGWKRVQPPL